MPSYKDKQKKSRIIPILLILIILAGGGGAALAFLAPQKFNALKQKALSLIHSTQEQPQSTSIALPPAGNLSSTGTQEPTSPQTEEKTKTENKQNNIPSIPSVSEPLANNSLQKELNKKDESTPSPEKDAHTNPQTQDAQKIESENKNILKKEKQSKNKKTKHIKQTKEPQTTHHETLVKPHLSIHLQEVSYHKNYVFVEGRATPDATIRLYWNKKYLGKTHATKNKKWSLRHALQTPTKDVNITIKASYKSSKKEINLTLPPPHPFHKVCKQSYFIKWRGKERHIVYHISKCHFKTEKKETHHTPMIKESFNHTTKIIERNAPQDVSQEEQEKDRLNTLGPLLHGHTPEFMTDLITGFPPSSKNATSPEGKKGKSASSSDYPFKIS